MNVTRDPQVPDHLTASIESEVVCPWRVAVFNTNFSRRKNQMLVLSRRVSERILIGNDVTVTITHIGPSAVKVGIDAPDWMNVIREELDNGGDLESRIGGAGRETD